MADIFVSYSRRDKARVTPLVQVLEDQGWSVWWDPKIQHGKRFDQVIKEELANTKCVVVVWSSNSIESRWILDEADNGAKRAILVPVMIEEVEIPFGFGRIDTAMLMGWSGDKSNDVLHQLVLSITNLLEPSAIHDTPAPKPSAAPRREAAAPQPAKTRPEPFRAGNRPVSGVRLDPTYGRPAFGFGTGSLTERMAMQRALLNSPEYKARQEKLRQTMETRRAKVEEQKAALRKSKLWWASLLFWPVISVASLFLLEGLVESLLAIVGRTWHWRPVALGQLALISGGLAWGIAYAIASAVNSSHWWQGLVLPFVPFTTVADGYGFMERAGSLLAAFPSNFIIAMGGAHGLAFAVSQWLPHLGILTSVGQNDSLYSGVMYSVFWLAIVIGIFTYALNFDEYYLNLDN